MLNARVRSPVAWAIVPAAYSIKHSIDLGRLGPHSWVNCRSSSRDWVAASQSVRAQARKTRCRRKLQQRDRRHSTRLVAFTIDSGISCGAVKPPTIFELDSALLESSGL
jgi:hypothetical protein